MDTKAITRRLTKALSYLASATLIVVVIALSLPSLLAVDVAQERSLSSQKSFDQFPVTVDPARRTIVERDEVNNLLEGPDSPLQAAAVTSGSVAHQIFVWIASAIANSPLADSLAAVGASQDRFVTLTPGMRREQAANAFAAVLGWTAAEKNSFLTASPGYLLPLPEGSFLEGTYTVHKGTSPLQAQAFVNDRFSSEVLSRYSTTTAEKVPLEDALTIASLIEREAGGADDMRIISGIIWNRLFLGMKLQIDATVQYAKASATPAYGWWPQIRPGDTSRKSAYNTYRNVGLPPGPIASPSVASILAALNPKNTSCLFYFHDSHGNFHCTDTYAEHVALLKQYFGRGR